MSAKERKGIVQMAICAVLWSISGVFIKMIPWNALVLAGFRSLIGASVLALYLLLSHRRFILTKRSLRLALTIPLTSICFMFANKLTTAANAIVLQYTAPVFLLIYEWFFHQKRFRMMDYLAVFLTMLGVALFFFDQLEGGAVLGNILAIFAGAAFAGTMFCVATVDEDARLNGLMQGHTLTALIGVPFLFVFGAPVGLQSLGALAVLGIFQLGLAYVLYGLAATNSTPLALTLLAALEPILNPVWVALFVGEVPGPTALAGGVLVLVSVTLWCVWDVRGKNQTARAQTI